MNIEDGSPIWEYETVGYSDHGVFVSDETIYSPRSSGEMICIDPESGEELDRFFVRDGYFGSICISEDVMFFETGFSEEESTQLVCLDLKSQATLWDCEVKGAINDIVFDEDKVFLFGYANKDEDVQGWSLLCLQAEDGEEIWDIEGDDNPGSMAVEGGFIYLSSYGEEVEWHEAEKFCACIDCDSGSEIWSCGLGVSYRYGGGSFAVTGDAVYCHSSDGLYCIDSASGEFTWSDNMELIGNLAVGGDYIYLASENRITCMDKDNGEFMWEWEEAGLSDNIALSRGKLFVSASGEDGYDSHIFCIGE